MNERSNTTESTTNGSENQSAKLFPLFVPGWFRDLLPRLKGAPLSVFLAYASHADKNGRPFPSLDRLWCETGYGHRAIKEARALLMGMGLLVPLGQERKAGKFGRKLFQVCLSPWALDRGTVDRGTVADLLRFSHASKVTHAKAEY